MESWKSAEFKESFYVEFLIEIVWTKFLIEDYLK